MIGRTHVTFNMNFIKYKFWNISQLNFARCVFFDFILSLPFTISELFAVSSKITKGRAEQWCGAHGDVPHFETSARDAINVELAFQEVARRAIKQLGLQPQQPMQKSIRLKRHQLDDVNDEQTEGSGGRRKGRRSPCDSVTTCDR